MICMKCRAAGTANSVNDIAIAVMFHEQCETIDCCCQHKTGKYTKA